MSSYLLTNEKDCCCGCEACAQVCPHKAIVMEEDDEGFRYPIVNENKCIKCGLCKKVCLYENMPERYEQNKLTFGGYHRDAHIRDLSTSGGAFSAIATAWCDSNYVIFGATSNKLTVYHTYITSVSELSKFQKSKYSQSAIGNSFSECKKFLEQGKNVLFSGTPCQIAGLKTFLGKSYENLLTIEVICEGIPSPYYMRKYDLYLSKKYNSHIEKLDYRYTDAYPRKKPFSGKWDFEVMYVLLQNNRTIKKDRWINPFWSIWLNHLMSRPSCYKCPFANTARAADISLGDLWGVHLYCPELYGNNLGASLIVCNTEKGKIALQKARTNLYGHELEFKEALKYQGPMRKTISENISRLDFMADLKNPDIDFKTLNRKWAKKPTLKLLWQKYVWGNRQKIFFWNLFHRNKTEKGINLQE